MASFEEEAGHPPVAGEKGEVKEGSKTVATQGSIGREGSCSQLK